MATRIYTKTGDKGETSLLGGTRVPKHHIRIEAYGTVDELNSFTALLRDTLTEEHTRQILQTVQERLFVIGAMLALDPAKSGKKGLELPPLKEGDITLLENEIDAMEKALPPLKSFILPGGHSVVSQCHVARSVARRAERTVVKLNESAGSCGLIIKYLNRLSDYLFVLARWLAKQLNTSEIPWNPKS